MSVKIIGLIDCDSFFASCETIFRPDWNGRPLVVLSNNDGCVVARSAAAKALKIPMGEPYFKLESFARSHGVIARSANFSLYGDMSSRVMQTLSQWTPEVDVYSIDEAFLDLTGLFLTYGGRLRGETDEFLNSGRSLGDIPDETRADLEKLAPQIVETVRRWTGVPVSLGLAPNRTLAKAASRLAKDEFNQTGRKYALLFNREERVAGLKRLALDKVWGVGRRLAPVFYKAGLKTAFDLAKLDPKFMRESFSINQERLTRELRGERIFETEPAPTPQRSLQIARSFGETVETLEELEKPVAHFAARAAAKLRERRLAATGVYVYLRTNPHNEKAPQRCVGRAVNLSKPTNLTPEILETSLKLARSLYLPGYAYKKAGVIMLETHSESVAAERRYLFEPDPDRTDEQRARDAKLCRAIDSLNAKLGKDSVFFASEGIDRQWRPHSSFVSPSYTTDWDALPVAH